MKDLPNSATHFSRKKTKPKKVLSRRFKRFVLPLLFVLLILIGVVVLQRVFVVRTVSCSMDDQACSDPVMAELRRLHDKSMFFVETSELEEKLHAALPKVKDITFEKKPPQSIAVTMHLYPSAFFIYSGKHFFLANEGGVLIEQIDTLPANEIEVKINSSELEEGDVIDVSAFTTLLTVVNELKKSSLVVFTVEYVDENQIILHLIDNRRAYLKSGEILSQLTTLQRLVNDATMTERGHIFDVRFAHPVVKNETPEINDGEE